MPAQNNFPAWFYGPGGKSKIFHRQEDVPEGWEDHPSKVVEAQESPDPIPMTRDDIIAGFGELGAPYKKNAPTAALYKQLCELRKIASRDCDPKSMSRDEVVAALKERRIEFNTMAPDEELRDLLISFVESDDAGK